MRRINQQLSDDECIQILNNSSRGFLSVIGDEEYPYVFPLNYVYSDNKIIFHSALEGHKIDSIKRKDKVSFCVLNNGKKAKDGWWNIFKSVIIFGKIKKIEDEDEKIQKLRLLGNKYFPSEEYTEEEIRNSSERALVLELNIEHMTGKIVTEK